MDAAVRATREADVNDFIAGRRWWRRVGQKFETVSIFFSGVSTILAYTASVDYDSGWVAFSAGVAGTVSLVALAYAAYGSRTSRERTRQLNIMLQTFDIEDVPDVTAPAHGINLRVIPTTTI